VQARHIDQWWRVALSSIPLEISGLHLPASRDAPWLRWSSSCSSSADWSTSNCGPATALPPTKRYT